MKITKTVLSIILCGCLLTGCGDSEKINMTEEDFPYGVTMTLNKLDFSAPVQYDERFLSADLVKSVCDYYVSFQTKDVGLYKSVQTEDYLNYCLDEVYSGSYTADDVVVGSYDNMVEYVGEDYIVSLIDITEATNDMTESNCSDILDMLDSISTEKDGSKVSENITQIFELTLDMYVSSASEGKTGYTSLKPVEDNICYAYELDGAWYLVV